MFIWNQFLKAALIPRLSKTGKFMKTHAKVKDGYRTKMIMTRLKGTSESVMTIMTLATGTITLFGKPLSAHKAIITDGKPHQQI